MKLSFQSAPSVRSTRSISAPPPATAPAAESLKRVPPTAPITCIGTLCWARDFLQALDVFFFERHDDARLRLAEQQGIAADHLMGLNAHAQRLFRTADAALGQGHGQTAVGNIMRRTEQSPARSPRGSSFAPPAPFSDRSTAACRGSSRERLVNIRCRPAPRACDRARPPRRPAVLNQGVTTRSTLSSNPTMPMVGVG